MTDVIMVVALTLWGECRGEPIEGKRAVASVIYWRAVKELSHDAGRQWPGQLERVCLKPRQFSCWNGGEVARPEPGQAWDECLELASALVGNTFRPSFFALNYHADYCKPHWAAGMSEVARIGRHVFLA